MNEACSEEVLFRVGSRVMAKRENVIARTADSDFVFLHPGEVLTVTALGCDMAICDRPERTGDVMVQTDDLREVL